MFKTEATVIKVDLKGKAGKFPCTDLTVETDKGEKTYKVFKKAPFHSKVEDLKSGSLITLCLEKNDSGYWNIADIETAKDEKKSAPFISTTKSNENYELRDLYIRRQVALKAAVELYSAVIKKVDDIDEGEIIECASLFEDYLREGYVAKNNANDVIEN